jgi:DNA-binding beta-propeller fold protein YncE
MKTDAACVVLVLVIAASGCDADRSNIGKLQAVWGRKGISDGRFQRPRAMAVDRNDHIYIVDMTARIQVFTPDGTFLSKWQTPDHQFGKPTGLSIANDGNILVANTHYYEVLIYSPGGELIKRLGGTKGERPGEFGLVTHAVTDSKNNIYVSEYGEFDRIQKFSPGGEFILQWGGHGSELGQFIRPQKMAVDADDNIWVADACNHRIQVFDSQGQLLKTWGKEGSRPGELYYPYDLLLAPDGTVYICEFGNHRVQRFTRDGVSLGCWGSEGRQEGQLNNPWALVRDSRGLIYVLDTYNHRVQVVKM